MVFLGIDFAVGLADQFLVGAGDAEFVSASEGLALLDNYLGDFRGRGCGIYKEENK